MRVKTLFVAMLAVAVMAALPAAGAQNGAREPRRATLKMASAFG